MKVELKKHVRNLLILAPALMLVCIALMNVVKAPIVSAETVGTTITDRKQTYTFTQTLAAGETYDKCFRIEERGVYLFTVKSDQNVSFELYEDIYGNYITCSNITEAGDVQLYMYLYDEFDYYLHFISDPDVNCTFTCEIIGSPEIALLQGINYQLDSSIAMVTRWDYIPEGFKPNADEWLMQDDLNSMGYYYLDPKDMNFAEEISVKNDSQKSIPIYVNKYDVFGGIELAPINSYNPNTFYYSLYDYRDYLAEMMELNKDAVELVDKMILFAAYSYQYFYGGDVGEVDYDAAEFDAFPDDSVFDPYKPTMSGSFADGVEYVGSSLILSYELTIRHYFSIDENKLNPETVEIYAYGDSRYPRYESTYGVTYDEATGLWYTDIPGTNGWKNAFFYTDLGEMYGITVYSGRIEDSYYEGNYDYENIWSMEYGAYSYAYKAVQGNNEKLEKLVKTLYIFSSKAHDMYGME